MHLTPWASGEVLHKKWIAVCLNAHKQPQTQKVQPKQQTTKTTSQVIDKNDQGSESHSHTKRPTTGDRCQQLLHEILGFHKNAHQCKPICVYLSNSGILNIWSTRKTWDMKSSSLTRKLTSDIQAASPEHMGCEGWSPRYWWTNHAWPQKASCPGGIHWPRDRRHHLWSHRHDRHMPSVQEIESQDIRVKYKL